MNSPTEKPATMSHPSLDRLLWAGLLLTGALAHVFYWGLIRLHDDTDLLLALAGAGGLCTIAIIARKGFRPEAIALVASVYFLGQLWMLLPFIYALIWLVRQFARAM